MEKKYQLKINDFSTAENTNKYKKLLKEKWDNNIYYCIEHMKYFEKETDTLKYFLFSDTDNNLLALMPFIFRKVENSYDQNSYFDVISPYGYSGPLFDKSIVESDITAFWNEVDIWYKENNVISEFVRFSLNENHKNYSGKLIHSLANIRGCLANDFETQWNAFLPKVRNNFRKAEKFNLSFQIFENETINKDAVKTFYGIYTATMQRNKANPLYYFTLEYFENLVLKNPENFIIAASCLEEKAISTELIIKIDDTIFGFLAGTDANYFSYRPNDFLRVKIIEWAIAQKKKFYVLGGGMTDGDGLYKNKKALFPKDTDVIFCTGRKILNQKAYDSLCTFTKANYQSVLQNDLDNSFFPLYRLVSTQ